MPGLLTLLGACVLAASCAVPGVRHARALQGNHVLPVVAVESFENRSGFPGDWQLGTGMADVLVSELMASRHFVVVERQHLGAVVSEINRQVNKMFRPEGKVETGKLRNAEYLIRGVINDFSQEGGGSLRIAFNKVLFGGRGYKARVSLTLTTVNIETGEILDSVQTYGIAMAREAYAAGRYKDIAFGGDAYFKTPLGVATVEAIRKGVNALTARMPRTEWRPMIAAVEHGEVILNAGTDRRIREGMLFDVQAAGRPVSDPATGDVLAVVPGPIRGRIRVTRVEERISYAAIVSGGGLERGQRLLRVDQAPSR